MGAGKPGGMPSLGAAPAKPKQASKPAPSKPKGPIGPVPTGGPPAGPMGGGGLSFLSELKAKLQQRNQEKKDDEKEKITVGPKDHFSGVKIVDADSKESDELKKEKKKEDQE